MLIEAITTSLSIIGLYYATSYELDSKGNPTEKNILWFVRFYIDKFIGEPYGKPFILCPKCMASFWGVVFYVGVFHHRFNNIMDVVVFIVFVLMTSTLNSLWQN